MFFGSLDFASPIVEWLITLLYVLLASIVTVDVLLKKGDVRAALGWIGAAWMSPILGSCLYYVFGINRVTRRSLQLPRLDSQRSQERGTALHPDAPRNIRLLSAIGEQVTSCPLVADNRIDTFQGGDAAYPAMIEAIRNAERCIALTSYIFRNDEAGKEFCDALAAATGRGVQVRVLLDSVGIGYLLPLSFWRLRAKGVPAARFLHTWLPWRMPFLNMRNHRKLLIVDGDVAFLGGMNIGAEYSKRLARSTYIDDLHFKIAGPAARLAMDAFARDWTFTTGEALDGAFWWPDIKPAGDILARGVRSGPDTDIYKIEAILGAVLTLAERRVRVVTPYFLPDQRLQFAIAQACLRGVDVEIVIPEHCDYAFLDWAMRAHLRFLNAKTVRIYATPAPFDHAKLVTMDGAWSLIGSSNWDTRSLRLNFEFDIECYDKSFAEVLDGIIDARIARARTVSLNDLARAPFPIKLRDAAARLLTPYL